LASPAQAILLVDDDPFLAHARSEALESFYDQVIRAADAAEALILVDQAAFARELALVVVALHMPGLSGPAFVAELTNRVPGVPVLVLCRKGECTDQYASENVHLLPVYSSMTEMLSATDELIRPAIIRIV
jgi:DNA-binding response OmpR family regulator